MSGGAITKGISFCFFQFSKAISLLPVLSPAQASKINAMNSSTISRKFSSGKREQWDFRYAVFMCVSVGKSHIVGRVIPLSP